MDGEFQCTVCSEYTDKWGINKCLKCEKLVCDDCFNVYFECSTCHLKRIEKPKKKITECLKNYLE